MNWKSVCDAYPVNKEMVWLNNCGITPAGRHISEAMACFMDGYSRKGVFSPNADYLRIRENIKKILASLLSCDPAELCLIHNTAEGMNFISHGLSLASGDEVILLENEYPSNVYPWRHLQGKGVRLKTAPMGDTPEAFLAGIEAMISGRTRVISLSAVHWCTGMPLPIEQVGQLCREKGITFVVDGAQGVGMQPIDVRKMNIGCMAFSAWKWLTGPLGLGVLYVARENLDALRPVFIGTESVIMDEEYLPYKSELKPTADRFTFSTASLGDWVWFEAALTFLNEIGFDAVRERIFELSDYLAQRLRKIGFQVCSDQFPGHPTGIVACEKPGVSSALLLERLKADGVIAAERLGRIRFSPHIYLDTWQLDRAARILSQACISQMYAQSVTKK
ncbi:aminotransferase class V-fold PLP-dependent enzy me [Desulfonema ishimotonii]|uniref:Aminotransferase class V-fold PLP-dependent enzy me n=1 Tax=Desulfonema ishimotonii TaxID=45657 RepID=A0A401FWV5_9BACT|nr:aminotransferase class V-fold PLP-dependent enzyme [Desulfonema ishimotonii]GBC61482.1 aminotransferase class V-fold PLP-dependent enzy me [Desulfonema ishimotonii]